MSAHWSTTALLFFTVLAVRPAFAQDAKKPQASNPVAVATPSGQAVPNNIAFGGERLSKLQVDAVQKISLYFNQLTTLKGTFVQTSADGKRQRGKFYIKRPGLFRFDYSLPSKLVIVSDGKYVAIQDHDLGTDARWDLEYTPFRMLLRKDVDLLRDAYFFDVRDTAEAIAISVVERGAGESGRISLVFAKSPSLQIKEWTAKDAQGLDTRIVLSDLARPDHLDPGLFNPATTAQTR
jgi:outer membrane lipoprotein-sorting protein